MKKLLGYVLVVIGLIALLDACHIGGRHTVISENGNGRERRIEYWGHVYFTADSTGISRISPNGKVKYKNNDFEISAESDYNGRITYQFNDGEKKKELDNNEKISLANAVRDMMKVGHYAK
ncbi:hypothetical protein FHW88_005384 [Mucilaginibacter sp. SG538B]|uniref:hypothetical protein n=1 Tax=Mucilaginibacter TaxID=423349 RepID=UPI00159DD224|nr:hypothetical protein [Mucilaginibacter sp. SG538B]NVM67063.1 hypothetical protein [Mucilaginibacter sp. SG538B]